MMRKVASAVLAVILALSPVCASAAATKLSGVNLSPIFFAVGLAPPFSFNPASYPDTPFQYETNPIVPVTSSFDVYPILGFNIICVPYNTSSIGVTNYPYHTEDNGISGGTVTIIETNIVNTTVTVANFTLPDSPHGGPYINYVSYTLPTPYTATASSTLSAYISHLTETSDQGWGSCVVSTIL
jgi:hypothetical protein